MKSNVQYKSYSAMRTVSKIYSFLGWLTLIGTVIFALIVLVNGMSVRGYYSSSLVTVAITVGSVLFTGGMMALGLLFVAQLIQVFLELVENSRDQTELLRRMAREQSDVR